MSKRRPLDRLAIAFRDGKGIKLSADEVRELIIGDDALERVVMDTIDELAEETQEVK